MSKKSYISSACTNTITSHVLARVHKASFCSLYIAYFSCCIFYLIFNQDPDLLLDIFFSLPFSSQKKTMLIAHSSHTTLTVSLFLIYNLFLYSAKIAFPKKQKKKKKIMFFTYIHSLTHIPMLTVTIPSTNITYEIMKHIVLQYINAKFNIFKITNERFLQRIKGVA